MGGVGATNAAGPVTAAGAAGTVEPAAPGSVRYWERREAYAESASQQRVARPSRISMRSGSSAQRKKAYGQRGWNLHPGGIRSGFGTTPLMTERGWPFVPRDGIDCRRPRVYGWRGWRRTSSTEPVSTIRPCLLYTSDAGDES